MNIRGISIETTMAILSKMTKNASDTGAQCATVVKMDGEKYGGQHVLIDKVEIYHEGGMLFGAIRGSLVAIESVATIDCG